STLSSLGAATARRIARMEGAEGELAIDDCCCADVARRPAARAPGDLPLVRL
ncbi:MAG: Hemin transport protein, partial [Stenotrophomonas indicatrix]